jgi:hypothetical protein
LIADWLDQHERGASASLHSAVPDGC